MGDYIQNLEDMTIPLDQLGLLVYARMYHQHFAIVLRNSIWTTRWDNSYLKCDLTFAFCGGVLFIDTCTGPGKALPSPPAILKEISAPGNEQPVNLSGRKHRHSASQSLVWCAKKTES